MIYCLYSSVYVSNSETLTHSEDSVSFPYMSKLPTLYPTLIVSFLILKPNILDSIILSLVNYIYSELDTWVFVNLTS